MEVISPYVHMFCLYSEGDYTQVRYVRIYFGILPTTYTHLKSCYVTSNETNNIKI